MQWQEIVIGRGGRHDGLEERVVKIRRCAAVVKGGRRFSFNALVVVGDKHGRVAWGYGKANEVPPAVEKAAKDAQETLKRQKQGPDEGRDDPAPGRRPVRRAAGSSWCRPARHRRQGWPWRSRRAWSAAASTTS